MEPPDAAILIACTSSDDVVAEPGGRREDTRLELQSEALSGLPLPQILLLDRRASARPPRCRRLEAALDRCSSTPGSNPLIGQSQQQSGTCASGTGPKGPARPLDQRRA
jgi:hypothetical protein